MKKSIYLDYSEEKFNFIKNILEKNNIKYKQKVQNHFEKLIGPGLGITRTGFANHGINTSYQSLYEIIVDSKDYEKSKALIKIFLME